MSRKGYSRPGLFGTVNHYDEYNKPAGSSTPGAFGTVNHSSTGGCYIATCVYSSYDCPRCSYVYLVAT